MDDAANSGMKASTDTGRTGDTDRLHELGYAQELKRGMSGFSNFAVSFTIISILSGCLTLFGFGMFTGGPAASAYGWLLVGFFVTFVGLAMAEVCSSYPTAGGLYYWSAKLAVKNGPAWAWFTGWFNMLGQVAITAGIDFGLSAFICAFMGIAFKVVATKTILVVTYTLVLAIHGLLNTFGVRLVAILNNVSVWWHVGGVLVILALCIILPDRHTSLGTIFNFKSSDCSAAVTGFCNGTLFTKSPIPGIGIIPYVFLIGMLLAQYTLTGYDASAHMTEETHVADVSGPKGIWKSIVISVFFGYILLIGVWYALDPAGGYAHALAFQYPATGNLAAPAAIFLDSFGKGFAIFAILIVIGAQFFCGMASVTTNSRMIYAFSRDGAVPGSKWWHAINKRTRTPTNAIWLAAVLAWLLLVPAYWKGSIVAYFAVTAIGVIGLYIAYVIPVYLRLRSGDKFKPGPWSLGKKGKLIGWIAVIWVIFISIVLMLPQYNWGGTTGIKLLDVFNFAPVVVGGLFIITGIWFAVSARKWFTGPKVMGTPEELAAIERELEQVS
jgi:amino acid transporter